MMSHREFVDIHVDDLRKRLPELLLKHSKARSFLHAFAGRAGAIIEASARLDQETGDYAKQRIAEVLVEATRLCRPVE